MSEDNHFYSQGFDAEDEFGMEEGENHEAPVVKPDSPVNYQTYMNKTPRTRWSKQDTQLFYEGIQEFGSNLSMVQQLFPERTRQQIKLKYKLEERKNPLKLNDALSTRSKQLTHYHNVIKKLQEEAAAAKEGEEEEEEGEEAGEEAETTTDVPENEEEPTKTEETERAGDGVAGVKESDGGDVENGVRSDGGDEIDDNEGDDDDFWNSYKMEKELLETPDDDIKHLPIRDMLRLVAYRESLEKKEAKGAPVVPPTQESNNTNASWDNQYYSQGFDAQDEFGMEEGENHVQVKPDSPVNYQTYMKKTPRTRWSKQETQVFYEGIQAFGINLSMVQQFLPKRRTLHQIKLKYKLEERKNPLKIDDALSTPCKDLTRYHIVLKKLQQEAAAAKEEEEAREEAETTSDVPENEEQTKSDERAGDGVAGVKESDGEDVENGVRSDGEDVENGVRSDGGDQFDENEGDDDDFWNSYRSEM
ncbi:hypothetical protein F2Q68_00005919 [Brassica cretica]|uniref:Myb-like domain-containing protein n=1 Tax=Brassica cretica TaxID=69181 RepID=A0A8S9JGZ6_BRACR|nr:hypothetical protein F2Q68_00005919 [Brassica cretica]